MSLQAAWQHLNTAVSELNAFAYEHPARVDETIATATDMAVAACSKLDADFYTEHEAQPTTDYEFVIHIETRAEMSADLIQETLDAHLGNLGDDDQLTVAALKTYQSSTKEKQHARSN